MTAKEIKELRLALNLSQQRFATKLGVGITTVVRWEKGRYSPSPLALARLEALQRRVAVNV